MKRALIWSKKQTKFTNFKLSTEVLMKVVDLMQIRVIYESLEPRVAGK